MRTAATPGRSVLFQSLRRVAILTSRILISLILTGTTRRRGRALPRASPIPIRACSRYRASRSRRHEFALKYRLRNRLSSRRRLYRFAKRGRTFGSDGSQWGHLSGLRPSMRSLRSFDSEGFSRPSRVTSVPVVWAG